ncbi:hypothetical protein [Nodularia chucula]
MLVLISVMRLRRQHHLTDVDIIFPFWLRHHYHFIAADYPPQHSQLRWL